MPSHAIDAPVSKSTLRKPMKLIEPHTGKMECRFCGSVHWANLKHGGGYHASSWRCHNLSCSANEMIWDVERQRWVRR